MTDAHLFIGGYGGGLVPLVRSGGTWSVGDAVAGTGDASWGIYSRRHGLHYLVREQDQGQIGAWRHDGGQWTCLGEVDSGGGLPCFLSLNADESVLAVANYGTGSIAFLALDLHGIPAGLNLFQNNGSGPNADRQEGAHAHCVRFAPDGRVAYSTDLGTDQVFGHPVDGAPFEAWKAPPGQGPRHILVTPGLTYLLTEMGSTLFVLRREADGRLSELQRLSTLPPGFTGPSDGGHLELHGDRLYVTNRGHDSVSVFAIGGDGTLQMIQNIPSGGCSPRHLLLLDDCALVAHQQSDSVTVLGLRDDGRLEPPHATLPAEKPAFIFRA